MGVFSDSCNRFSDLCSRLFHCPTDPAAKENVSTVILHLVYLGVLLIFDKGFVGKFSTDPWYNAIYLLLFVATLAQYFLISCSSPGYVLDAMKDVSVADLFTRRSLMASKQPASSKNNSVIIKVDGSDLGRSLLESNATSWTKLVSGLYPPGSSERDWTCTYCNLVKPPRAKHCHNCDECVLQFDHHCLWLGTCIGQRNHCRFWWYIFEESALSTWTAILYIVFLKSQLSESWCLSIPIVILLGLLSVPLGIVLSLLFFHSYLVMTNQTTYELLTERSRIQYLRSLNDRIFPFSKGVCENLYNFCCLRSRTYMESLPTHEELEEKSRPYTCLDVVSCRCC